MGQIVEVSKYQLEQQMGIRAVISISLCIFGLLGCSSTTKVEDPQDKSYVSNGKVVAVKSSDFSGIEIIRDDSGNTLFENHFQNGQLIKKQEYRNGALLSETTFDYKGRPQAKTLYSSNASIKQKHTYYSGELFSTESYDEQGRLKSKQQYKNGRVLFDVNYYPSGSRESSFTFDSFTGERTESYYYFENGQTKKMVSSNGVFLWDEEGNAIISPYDKERRELAQKVSKLEARNKERMAAVKNINLNTSQADVSQAYREIGGACSANTTEYSTHKTVQLVCRQTDGTTDYYYFKNGVMYATQR